jgi:hypothetical protein
MAVGLYRVVCPALSIKIAAWATYRDDFEKRVWLRSSVVSVSKWADRMKDREKRRER